MFTQSSWQARSVGPLIAATIAIALLASGCEPGSESDDGGVPDDADASVDAGPTIEGPVEPDLYCPGGPSCPGEGDGRLYVGAAAIPITPSLEGSETLLVDVDEDGEFDPVDGDTFEDLDGDGQFDGVWLAGFGNGRAAEEVLDEQWARAIALRQNDTTLVFLSLDVVGLFLDDADAIRAEVADEDLDYLLVSATHNHEGPDTIGIWGVSFDLSGRSEAYMERLHQQAALAVRTALAALRPAHIQYASTRLRQQPGGMLRYVSDSRDPQIIDDQIRTMRFMEATGGETIATLVNFAAHAEYMGGRNTGLSSDFPHWLRESVEQGVVGPDGPEPGVGGICVFVNGALGSQIGPNRVRLESWDGTSVDAGSALAAQTMGEQIGYFILRSLGPEGGSTTEETANLGFRRHRFFLPIENSGYQVAFLQNIFVRQTYNYDRDRPIESGRNEPELLTEIAVVDVGRAQMITCPGELDPSLFIGGYDGSHTPVGEEIVDLGDENPPNIDGAPAGPYLRDLARADADQVWLLGLTQDFLGYFVPEYDYELDATQPYLDEAEGSHYEETNSLGVNAWPRVARKIAELLAWRPRD